MTVGFYSLGCALRGLPRIGTNFHECFLGWVLGLMPAALDHGRHGITRNRVDGTELGLGARYLLPRACADRGGSC